MFLEIRKDLDLQQKAATFGQHHPLQVIDKTNIRLLDPHRDYYFRSWLPNTIQTRQMRLVYSAEVHGRGLDTLYRSCQNSKGIMMLLVEVLETGTVIGAIASDPLIRHASFFGDFKTFVFRLHPNPQRYKNKHCIEDELTIISPSESGDTARTSILTPSPSPKHPRQSYRLSAASEASGGAASREQFLLCLGDFLAIGVDTDSSAAVLRLNLELTRGSSEPTALLDNPALVDGLDHFEVGGVEVYDFINL